MGRQTEPPPFTAEDAAFVERCVANVAAALPAPLRTAVATCGGGGSSSSFAYCVPPDM